MFRKLFGRGRKQASPGAVAPAASRRRPATPHELDEPLQRHRQQQLVELGIAPDDPQLRSLSVDELGAVATKVSGTFRQQEHGWWNAELSRNEKTALTNAIKRYTMGGTPTPPYIHRPFDYSSFSQYPEISIETSRKLTDRGLEVAQDAESRHFILLSGIKREWAFDLADDATSNARLLDFAEQLRTNRPAAEKIMKARWGDLPPSRGQEHDTMPFNLEDRRIRFIYRQRNEDPAALDRTIEICRAMIARSPEFIRLFHGLGIPLPTHKGFEQLAIILDRRKEYAAAVAVCEQALAEGWEGDWEKRIERYSRKIRPKTNE